MNDAVTIVSFPGTLTCSKVRQKLNAMFENENRSIGFVHMNNWTEFSTQHGITENDRVALENIIKGLIEVFGED